MDKKTLVEMANSTAKALGLDPDLVSAICSQESNYTPAAARYEKNWGYFFEVERFSKILGITYDTEYQLQKFSFGIMQVMGSVARELGFQGYLTELITPENGILYGCKKLKALSKRYSNVSDVIAAYNGGNASKVNGNYPNRRYVEDVQKRIAILKKIN